MKKIIIFALFSSVLVLPFATSAATYHYVTMEGEVTSIEAATPAEALAIVAARGDALHSGVKMDSGLLDEGEVFAQEYQYVDMSGNVRTVIATSVDAARILATDIAPTSALVVVEAVVEEQ